MEILFRRSFPRVWIGIAISLLSWAGVAWGQPADPELYQQLHYRHIGPVGNRVSTVAGVAGDPLTYYGGAASGGVWKTVDGGLNWEPVFDKVAVSSIGAIAVAPSDPNVVYVGTGESFIRSNVSIGNGIYRSTDAGKTWTHVGLDNTGRIGRVVVDPGNPDVAYAAALGHGYTPQQDRGVFRTRDGGTTWQKVLFVDENTGASDLAMDPNNPRILFAGMWQLELKTWVRNSGGPGSGLYVSRDAGDTWTRLKGNGLPDEPVGKIAVCMTPRDSRRVYALIETSDGIPVEGKDREGGELWRSDDGGEHWKLTTHNQDLAGRSAYYSRCAVSPDDADEVYFAAADYSVTKNGGESFQSHEFGQAPGYDHHDIWVDPSDGNRMIVGHDGGVSISQNRGASWLRVQLPVAQMYHVTVDNLIPYNVYGNRQDGPSVRGPSNSRLGSNLGQGGIPRGLWHSVGGGESGFATPDPVDPDVIWSSASGFGPVGGIVTRYSERTRQFRQVEVWPESTIGWPAADLKYRFQWTFPVLVSPHDHNTVYVTSQHVHRTRNGGQSWEEISPDLTSDDKSKQTISGGLTPDNIGVEYCCVVYAFDESPARQGVLWAGTNDGLVHVSRDGGGTWENVTANIPDLPPLGTVRNIDASKWNPGKAYITVDFHQVGNFAPYVYKTEDFGKTWTKITRGIPESNLSYCRNIREDPVRKGLLYLGTENALYVSYDDGGEWRSLQTNLPPAPVYWIAVQEGFNDLVVGTYGRGFWILDDITPLQQLTEEMVASKSALFAPRPAYRFQPITEPMGPFDDPSAGDNPPYGAVINYWLAEAPEGEVSIRIEDSAGNVVRTLKPDKKQNATQASLPVKGINRVWWDLRGEPSEEIKLRTTPPQASWVDLGKEGWRSGGNRVSVLVPPGVYNVVLKVGETESKRELQVLKDPNTVGGEADIQAQTEMLRALREDLNSAAGTVNDIESMRRQLRDLALLLKDRKEKEEVLEKAKAVGEKLVAVEGKLTQLKLTGTGQDDVRWPSMLVQRLAYLAGSVANGDFPPTDQHREVHQLLRDRLKAAQSELKGIVETDVGEFNQLLMDRKLSGIIP